MPQVRHRRATGPRNSTAGVTRAGLVGGLIIVAVFAYVVIQSFWLEAAQCEVCMSYHAQNVCRTVGGSNIEEARKAAIVNACAFLSSGVTDSMACQRETPVTESCH